MKRRPSGPAGPPRFEFPDGELESAVWLGDVTDRFVRVWVRRPAGPVEAGLTVGGEERASLTLEPDAAHDHVAAGVLALEDPRSGQEFEVTVGDERRGGRFAPSPGSRAAFSFAFGSCHQPFTESADGGRVEKQPAAGIYPHLERLAAERRAAFGLWLGDQVYSDAVSEMSVRERMAEDRSVTDDSLLETYRHLYRGYFNESGYRALNDALPAYLMWDDHDIFDGWGSLLDRTPFDERLYQAAEGAYREYQHLRNPTGSLDAEAPYGYSFWYGDVGFHVPDLRGERDFRSERVLGDAGWARLDAFLREASEREVPTIFIGLSVPLVHASPALTTALERLPTGSGRDVRDRWSVPAFAGQRSMLLERLFGWQSGGSHRQVIVLSGDVHVGAAFRVRERGGPGRFRQWTSSALSTPTGLKHVLANRLVTTFVRLGERELHVRRLGLAPSNNVGLVEVEPAEGGGHTIRLSVHQYDAGRDRLAATMSDLARPA